MWRWRGPGRWAAEHGRDATVRRLLAEGADVCGCRKGEPSKGDLQYDSMGRLIRDQAWREFFCGGATEGFSPFMLSIYHRHDLVTRILLENGANIRERYPEEYSECTVLHMAVEMGSSAVVKLLLENGFPVDALDKYHQTALHWALVALDNNRDNMNDRFKTVTVLLRHHANPDIVDRIGQTPRDMARKYGNLLHDMICGLF